MLYEEHFRQGTAALAQGDPATALRELYTCLTENENHLSAGDTGLIYHKIGNCLMGLGGYSDACTAYKNALADAAYPQISSVHYNYGQALSKQGSYEAAVEQYKAVLADPSYPRHYKVNDAMGNAYMQLGDFAQAGAAFRNAAIDEANPASSSSLLNLGVCFMALDRPADAIETYKTIFEFDNEPAFVNRANSNLGQAYVANGDMEEATKAFDRALADGTYQLTPAAEADYMKARQAVSAALIDSRGIDAMGGDDTAVFSFEDLPEADLRLEDTSEYYANLGADGDAFADDETYGAGIPSADDTGFFEVPDELSADEIRMSRKKRGRGLKVLLVVVILLVVLIAACGVLYWQGFGFPTQEQTINQLFAEHASGQDASDCWIGTSSDEDKTRIARIMNSVAPTTDITIDYLEPGTLDSEAIVTATTSEGGQVRYDISLTRDFSSLISWVGWKVNGIELAFPSTAGE